MNVTTWWKASSFWNKIRALLGIFGPGTELALIATHTNPNFQIALCILGGLGYGISIIMEDKDNDGVVDIFEDKPTV